MSLLVRVIMPASDETMAVVSGFATMYVPWPLLRWLVRSHDVVTLIARESRDCEKHGWASVFTSYTGCLL